MRTLLRVLVAAFFGVHAALLFPNFASAWFLGAAAAGGWIGGALTSRWRGLLSAATGVGVSVTVVALLMLVPQLLAGTQPDLLDSLPLWADRQLLLGALPFAWFWWEGWFFFGREDRRGVERLAHGFLLVALFWSQGPYHVTLYPHPLQWALALACLLAAEVVLALDPRHVSRLRPAAALAAMMMVLMGAGSVWSLFLKYQDSSTASGGGLMKPDLFQFDFAPLIRLEDQISLGDNLVLLYREEGTPRTRYLRRMVLDDYDPASGFSVGKDAVPVIGKLPLTYPVRDAQERTRVVQEYYLVNLDPSSLLTLNQPERVEPYARWNQSSFVNAYRVESLVSSDSLWLYNDQIADGLTAQDRARFLKGGDDPEIKALALQMTQGAHTPYEKATAILLALKDHYYYSLKPGRPGPRGALKHFLFENKKGYCSYFAFGMTLLLRSVGVPARIAVGFVTDPNDSVLGFTPVRAFQAHAWVEVPFGPYGWLEFDPTSDTPAPGERLQFPKGTDPQVLSKLIAEILQAHPHPLEHTGSETQRPSESSGLVWWRQALNHVPWWLLAAAIVTNEIWRVRWKLRYHLTRDPRRRWRILWLRLVAQGRQARRGPTRGQTPESWARQVNQAELIATAEKVVRARYGPLTPAVPTADERAEFRRLERWLIVQQPLYRRILTAAFPWWPA